MLDDFSPSITAEHIQIGMILQFAGQLADTPILGPVPVWAAEVVHTEAPDGLGEHVGLYVLPEDSEQEVYVEADPQRHYAILG